MQTKAANNRCAWEIRAASTQSRIEQLFSREIMRPPFVDRVSPRVCVSTNFFFAFERIVSFERQQLQLAANDLFQHTINIQHSITVRACVRIEIAFRSFTAVHIYHIFNIKEIEEWCKTMYDDNSDKKKTQKTRKKTRAMNGRYAQHLAYAFMARVLFLERRTLSAKICQFTPCTRE